MIIRRWLTVLVSVLSVLLAPTLADALWSATADGSTAVAAATMTGGGDFSASCTSAAHDSTVALSWTASPDSFVDGYEIVRTDSPGGAQSTLATGSGVTTLTDSPPVGAGLSYAYAIRATSGAWTTPLLPAADAPAYTAYGCSPAPSLLLSAASFSVLGGTTGVTSTGATSVSGDLGSAGAVGGFPPGEVAGTVHEGDAVAAQAHVDLTAAYDNLDGRAATNQFSGDLTDLTFYPGVHHTAVAVALTGTVTLDAQGDPDAVFVFQVDAALNTAAASKVLLTNEAQASNVYWQVNGAAGMGAGAAFSGTLLATGGITIGEGATLIGRALSYGTVTLANNQIRFTVALPPDVTIGGGADAVTKDTTPTLTGTAPAGTTVTVTVDDQTLITTAGPTGGWTVTAAELPGGTYAVKASVRDEAGNAGSATQSLSVEVNPAPVDLQSAAEFAVLGGTGGITNTGVSSITGDVGVSPDQEVVGLPQEMVTGTFHVGDATAVQAHSDRAAAYAEVNARTATKEFSGDLNGITFRAGVHHTTAALALTGTLTLDAEGDPAAVFIIQVDAALNTAAGSQVVLINGALASNVFWQAEGAAGLGANSTFAGTILAAGAITVGDGTQLTGRALSAGAVTLANNTIG